ncbi:PTS transporter subunit EIIC [Erysipelothrix tonsillarum]|uniref:PTS transporter subunit EIIC n=1 Tax=Erysipelothrix tonsillarum TaxID=38402 RepID=UPI0003701947|nr:PTS transporter subunit EIIC [Erysipelothrix tonsillarum]
MNYQDIASRILEAVGGKTNVQNFEHCATRLRIIVKNNDAVDAGKIELLKENIGGYFFQSGQHQFIIGTGKVNNVFEAFQKELGQEIQSSDEFKQDAYANMKPVQKLMRIFADVLIPLIPALVTTGLLMGIRGMLNNLGVVMSPEFASLFEMLTDIAFAFLPVLITYSATKRFGGNPILGIVVGLMMVAPQLPNAWAVATGGAEPMMLNIFGFTVSIVGYQGSVLPGIFAGWLVAWVERNVRKVVPAMMDLIVTPFVSILVSISVVLVLVGPILHSVEQFATQGVLVLTQIPFGIGQIIYAAIQQVIVITGMHHALSVIEIQLINETGVNILQPLGTASMAGQFGAAIAIATLLKNKKQKSNALSASASTLFGITEPLLFGVTLPQPKAFAMGMIGGAVGGLVTYLFKVAPAGMGITFIPGLLLYTESFTAILGYLLVIVSAFATAFILTRLFVKIEQ